MRNLGFGPGALVRARGREWVVIEAAGSDRLTLRPLGAADAGVETVDPALERDLGGAAFAPPQPERAGPSAEARLLRDALALTLRRGAGPFRSFGRLAFEPRAYQLVPLLMALKQDPIRLLIADDVGIGKTIEAGLIARELLDRGEIARMAVLCPPHLVEQWTQELAAKFALDATAVTAATASRLERGLPIGTSLFQAHPFTVVSLDFVKSERRRAEFATACPELVIVDEAHACIGSGEGRKQQRYALLCKLAERSGRHLLLLTATPHTGDAGAFARLTGLLDPAFEALDGGSGETRAALRQRLADHLVQRRRRDIDAWREPGLFPRREAKEATYRLHPEAKAFFEAVLDYCAEVTDRAGADERRRRLAFWGTLALMRCVASSPTAAVQALQTRAQLDELSEEAVQAQAADGEADDLPSNDNEPPAIDDPALAGLLQRARALALDPRKDFKLKQLLAEVRQLVADGFHPVVFCRFIATAKGVAAALEGALKDAEVALVTGELPPEERRARIDAFTESEAPQRVLVATDCLSEGINLQSHFDAVVHYDLCWNPTRHQQREGRVDRFGQRSPRVRTLLLYGEDNPVDGAVLQVILRKAERIRADTGVPVPLPDDERAMTAALLQAVLLRRGGGERQTQLALFDELPEARMIEQAWRDASEREKQSQTIFAQRALKPDTVIPEWDKARAALGSGPEATRRFLDGALTRFNVPLIKTRSGWCFRLPDNFRHQALADRLAALGVPASLQLSFEPGAAKGYVHRAHPLVAATAEILFERALDPAADPADVATIARCGVWQTRGVDQRTTLLLLRLRHRLEPADGRPAMLAEEASALAFTGKVTLSLAAQGEAAAALLDGQAEGDIAEHLRRQLLADALARLPELTPACDAHAHERAEALRHDHDRVRAATMRDRRTSVARINVLPVTPVDVVGLYLLLPVLH